MLYVRNPKLTSLGGMLSVALLSPKAASLPSCIDSKLGLRPNIIAMVMLGAGLKPDVGTRNCFRSLSACI